MINLNCVEPTVFWLFKSLLFILLLKMSHNFMVLKAFVVVYYPTA